MLKTIFPLCNIRIGWIQKWHDQVVAATSGLHRQLVAYVTIPLLLVFTIEGPPTKDIMHIALKGISEDFRIRYSYGNLVLTSAKQNIQGSITYPDVVEDYLHIETRFGRLVRRPIPITCSA